ncbi:MAG: FtsX-like permease family protein [Rhodanobacteraceae bacterium]|nr:MAG: FtsX-like permease family protein [Rhodanobacteraceae bacterium]
MISARLALRSLRREWRLPELRTLAAALLLAVVVLGAVATLAARMQRAIVMNSASLIGGDLAVDAASPLPPAFAQHAHALGLRTSRFAGFPSVAFAGGRSQLLSVTAGDAAWPLRGKLVVANPSGRNANVHAPAVGEVYVDHRALVALGLQAGQSLQVGGMTLRITGVIQQQPGAGDLIALAPRAVLSLADAQRAGLLGTGSRAKHQLLVAGSPAAVAAYRAWAKAHLPGDAHLVTPEEVQQRLAVAFARAGTFLKLSGLLAALLAGIAVALSAQRYARRKTGEVALLRALGASSRFAFGSLAFTLAVPAVLAALAGVGIALALAALAFTYAHGLLPPAARAAPLPLGPAFAAAGIGIAVLGGFALPPLARLQSVPPMAVFRRTAIQASRRYDALYAVPVLVALGLLALETGSWKLAGVLAASLSGAAAFTVLLTLVGLALIRRYAARLGPALRLGVSALARRRGISLIQTCAIALGLTALLLLAVIAPNLLQSWRQELPPDTPNWFVINIETAQRADIQRALHAVGATGFNAMPVAVGKLVAINGVDVENAPFRGHDLREEAAQQVRLSWATALPAANRIVDGHWFQPDAKTPEVSLDIAWIRRFDLHLGDTLGFLVGNRRIDARLTSIRQVDWSRFNVNFFVLLDPAHGATLPHTWIASFHLPRTRSAALAGFSRDFPSLSLIDVNQLLDRARQIVAQVGAAARWVLAFSLIAGALVLAAALTMSAAERRHEAALLRTLGARRSQLRLAALCEFGLLGAIAGLTALLASALGGMWLAHSVFRIHAFTPPWATLALVALASAVAVAALGLAGTRKIVRTPPLRLLRRD